MKSIFFRKGLIEFSFISFLFRKNQHIQKRERERGREKEREGERERGRKREREKERERERDRKNMCTNGLS
jgi:hypothetical protein